MSNARIWAAVSGASTDTVTGQRKLVGVWQDRPDQHHAVEYVRADLAAQPAVQREPLDQWEPISSAPDYGIWFLAAYEGSNGWIAEVVAFEDSLTTRDGSEFPATHWTYLPPAPAAINGG